MGLELKELLETMPQTGQVRWLGVRPEKGADLTVVSSVEAQTDVGLTGDHFFGKPGAKRQVTLIQYEHIAVVAAILGLEKIDPNLLRRNIVVSGLNLQSLKDRQFSVGDVVLFGSGNCPPCSRMEENLGAGGYNAMRGHGGITAQVFSGGTIELGAPVRLLPSEQWV